MNAFNDATCEKCGHKIAWMGPISKRPPCDECGHLPDEKSLRRAEQEVMAARAAVSEQMKNDNLEDHLLALASRITALEKSWDHTNKKVNALTSNAIEARYADAIDSLKESVLILTETVQGLADAIVKNQI